MDLYYTKHLSNVGEIFLATDPTLPEIQKSFDIVWVLNRSVIPDIQGETSNFIFTVIINEASLKGPF